MKLQCGEHEQYTTLHETLWIDDGFGMMAMYKQDWIDVGGKKFYIVLLNKMVSLAVVWGFIGTE